MNDTRFCFNPFLTALCCFGVLLFSGCSLPFDFLTYDDLHPESEDVDVKTRYAARFEQLAATYIEAQQLTDLVTIEEPITTETQYLYAFCYNTEGYNVYINLIGHHFGEEYVRVEIRCDPEDDVIDLMNTIQSAFTGKNFSRERLTDAFSEVKQCEDDPDRPREDLDLMGYYFVDYDSAPVPERWAKNDANRVAYCFQGKLAQSTTIST